MAGEHQFELTGGRLCLDFANTLDNRPAGNRRDYLTGYAELVAWGRQTRVLNPGEASKLLREAGRVPKQAVAALVRAKALRELLFRMFAALANGRRIASADLAQFNGFAADLPTTLRLVQSRRAFGLVDAAPPEQLDRLLAPVLRSTLEFLLSADVPLLRECSADNCAWLFVDTTKNHRRRWCDARTCGNRAKVHRFRERLRQHVRPKR